MLPAAQGAGAASASGTQDALSVRHVVPCSFPTCARDRQAASRGDRCHLPAGASVLGAQAVPGPTPLAEPWRGGRLGRTCPSTRGASPFPLPRLPSALPIRPPADTAAAPRGLPHGRQPGQTHREPRARGRSSRHKRLPREAPCPPPSEMIFTTRQHFTFPTRTFFLLLEMPGRRLCAHPADGTLPAPPLRQPLGGNQPLSLRISGQVYASASGSHGVE